MFSAETLDDDRQLGVFSAITGSAPSGALPGVFGDQVGSRDVRDIIRVTRELTPVARAAAG
jgi:hypothetical protein